MSDSRSKKTGGKGGIRTHGARKGTQHFQCCQFNHSCTFPAFSKEYGGEGGIRTHGARKGTTIFETVRFNHSRTSPQKLDPGARPSGGAAGFPLPKIPEEAAHQVGTFFLQNSGMNFDLMIQRTVVAQFEA